MEKHEHKEITGHSEPRAHSPDMGWAGGSCFLHLSVDEKMIPNPKIYACRMLHRDEVMRSQSTSLRGEFGKLEQDPVKSRLQNKAPGTLDS